MAIYYFPPQGGGGGGGTVTGAANVGTGVQVFKMLSGTTLQFRTFSDNSYVTWTQNANDITAHVLLADFATAAGSVSGGTPNTFAYFNGSGDLDSINGWTVSASPINGASQVNLLNEPNNLTNNEQGFGWNVSVEPLQDSPNDSLTLHTFFANFDNAASGFDFGGSTLLNIGYTYNGNGSVYGRTNYISANAGVGNGTDPVTVLGHSFFSGSWNVSANATVDGSIQGYSFQPTLNAASITTSNTGVTAFLDIATLPVSIHSYQSASFTPQIGTIANNSGYTGINVNPQISNFAGNANAIGFSVNGSFANFGSGGFTGVIVNPDLNTLVNNNTMLQLGGQSASGTGTWTGLQISDGAINTSGTVKGLQINVDPANDAIDSQGHHALQSQNDLVSSLGQVSGNVIGGSLIVPDATAITGTDYFGNNFAVSVDLGDATSSFVSPSGLVGLTSVGFVGQITGDGDADLLNFCLSGYQTSHTGTINRVNNYYAACIPTGAGGTMNESVLFLGNYPFGGVATDHWGIRIEDTTTLPQNFLPRLAIATTNKKTVGGVQLQVAQAIDAPALSEYYTIKTDQSMHIDTNTTVTMGAFNSAIDLKIDTGITAGGGMFCFQSMINRTDPADLGTSGILIGNYNVLNQSTACITSAYAGFATGTHSISGGGTVANLVDFYALGSSIDPGIVTNRFGILIEPDSGYIKQNWLSGRLLVSGASSSPTNASCGIELAGNDSAVLLSRLTTTERNALTPVNGMEIYNSTTDTFQDYTAGVWVDRGSGSGSGIFTTSTTTINTNTTLVDKVYYYVDTTGGAVTLTLPAVSSTLCIRVKDKAGTANANPITLLQPGAENIDGSATTYDLDSDFGAWEINSDGTDYFIA